MSLEDGRFKTDGKKIEPCCKQMEISILCDNLRSPYLCTDGIAKVQVWVPCSSTKCDRWSWYDDISFCPFCGAELEYVEKVS